MAKLFLKFEQAVIKEVMFSRGVLTIGRLPDNALQIDNLAVSGYHAKIYWDIDHYVVEDSDSLNGTYVNNQRVTKTALKDGDTIIIGKHTLLFKDDGPEENLATQQVREHTSRPAPELKATMVLDTKKAKELLAGAAAQGRTAGDTQIKERTGMLTVMKGKTDMRQYFLRAKLSVIGKSDLSSIKLKGWFAPEIAAVINKRDDRYFITPSQKHTKLRVNDTIVSGQMELRGGDIIEVARVTMTFAYKD